MSRSSHLDLLATYQQVTCLRTCCSDWLDNYSTMGSLTLMSGRLKVYMDSYSISLSRVSVLPELAHTHAGDECWDSLSESKDLSDLS